MKMSVIHPITRIENTIELPNLKEERWKEFISIPPLQRPLIQSFFSRQELNPEEREFLISGLLPGEFDEMFKDE